MAQFQTVRTGKIKAGLALAGVIGMAMPALAQTATPTKPVAAKPVSAKPVTGETVPGRTLDEKLRNILGTIPKGARAGFVVSTLEGREIIAIRPDERFVPASNTKLFTTAAAYTFLPDLKNGTAPRGNAVLIGSGARPDISLIGYGDARMSSAPDCQVDCLATLADAIAKQHRTVGDIIGDSRYLVDDRFSMGMAWNNIPTRSGAGLAALSLDGNEVALMLKPGAGQGAAALVEAPGYYRVINRVVTRAEMPTKIDYYRSPGSRDILLTGTIQPASSGQQGNSGQPAPTGQRIRFGIEDPADYAAFRLAELLRARGVAVTGKTRALYRLPDAPAPVDTPTTLSLTPPSLADDVRIINKDSQNVYAELLLRRVGASQGDGSVEGGLKAVEAMLAQAGVPRTAWDFSDGSGMSTYNRVSPRATTQLLRWAANQPWGMAWRQSLPIGGSDGTLVRRYADTPLHGKIFAKTGTVNAATALSGYLVTAKGQTLVFSSYVADIPADGSVTAIVDKALLLIAAEN